MTDEEFDGYIKKIDNPLDMLKCLIDNIDFYGHDPYFADIKETIFKKAEEIHKEFKDGKNNEEIF